LGLCDLEIISECPSLRGNASKIAIECSVSYIFLALIFPLTISQNTHLFIEFIVIFCATVQ